MFSRHFAYFFQAQKRMLLTLFSLCLLCACEETFEIDSKGGRSKLFVQCYAGLGDTTFVHIRKAVPVNASEPPEFTLNSVGFRAGGVPVELNKDSETLYWSTSPIIPGSGLVFEAEAKGLPKVCASSNVPEMLDFHTEARVEEYSYVGRVLRMKAVFDKPLPEDEYFGACVVAHTEVMSDGVVEDSSESVVPFSIGAIGGSLSDMISSAMGGGTMDINIGGNKHISVLLFNSNDLTDGSICFNSDCIGINGDYSGEDGGKAVVVEYRLNIYSFSKECYYYFQALDNQDRNFLAQLGLSPPNYSYSNVAGGYGVVAGLNLTPGEWVRYADILSE